MLEVKGVKSRAELQDALRDMLKERYGPEIAKRMGEKAFVKELDNSPAGLTLLKARRLKMLLEDGKVYSTIMQAKKPGYDYDIVVAGAVAIVASAYLNEAKVGEACDKILSALDNGSVRDEADSLERIAKLGARPERAIRRQ